MSKTNVLFVELQSPLTDGRAFDALVPGEHIDMLGREVQFKKSELADYVANTQKAIDAATSESGEVVGLPIDTLNHNHENAAGWIVAVELVGDVVRVIPKWTRIGRELISEGIQRFFSATIDLQNKTILGGSLTNWPAIRGKGGAVLLRPIELSESLCEIVQDDGSQIKELDMAKAKVEQPETKELEVKEDNVTNVTNVSFDLAALKAEMKAEALAEFQAENKEDDATKRLEDAVKLEAFADVADLSQARGQLVEQMQAALKAEFERVQADSGKMLNQMMVQMKRDQHIAEFSQRMVSGTEQRPYGLPVGQEEVETFLLSLNDQQREAAESILTRTHEQGLVQFSAIGHGKRLQGVATFPAEFSASLTSWLDDGGSKQEYFAENAEELGEMAQYNLDEYKEND